ncbi:GNAT family N-acetyltransferase [Paracoccus sp. (in: a-proteobacteria)]|uniref:GNAT family N-acetyltransferase n=1 Tax=Paracoccus sp. TaxID=267 RepID=UPI0028AD61AB|nr:GNAT family N-acetyltransferase [Paracoccus sp. (in: a-proteobacteria)]
MAEFGFRPVTRADLPMLADWLRQPEVARWWPGSDELAGIEQDLDEPAMRQVIAFGDDVPLGYAQYYPPHHWSAPHFADLAPDAIAVDCFSGPEGFGRGGDWLRALADSLLEQAALLVIDPDPRNLRAIRAYEKAGFRGEELRPSENGTLARIMTRHR